MISKREPLRRLQLWQPDLSVGDELLREFELSAESFYFIFLIKSHDNLPAAPVDPVFWISNPL